MAFKSHDDLSEKDQALFRQTFLSGSELDLLVKIHEGHWDKDTYNVLVKAKQGPPSAFELGVEALHTVLRAGVSGLVPKSRLYFGRVLRLVDAKDYKNAGNVLHGVEKSLRRRGRYDESKNIEQLTSIAAILEAYSL